MINSSLSILKKLVDYMEKEGIRQSREILLAEGHRRIRNKSVHEGWEPIESESDDTVCHVSKVIAFLEKELK